MRTLWTGTLSFGLVSIPVKMYAATSDRSPSFNQLRSSDHSRIGYKRVAKADDEAVEFAEIVKGYEYESDRYVVFDADELQALKPSSSKSLDILQFVPLKQIDPIYFQRGYHLIPEPSGLKPYGLLASVMRDQETVAICKVTLRDKEHLATLRLRGDVFVLETMWWPDEIHDIALSDFNIDELPEPRPQELKMAKSLLSDLTEDFDPSAYTDEHRERVLEAVQAKIAGEEVTVVDDDGEPAEVVDLVDALRQSVEAAKNRRKGDDGEKASAGSKRKKKAS